MMIQWGWVKQLNDASTWDLIVRNEIEAIKLGFTDLLRE
jgi:hypothetical protein